MLNILSYSIIIGGIIGIAISVDEFSKKRMLITFLCTYLIVVILLYFIERQGLTTIYYVSNGIEFSIKFLLIYTALFGLVFLGKKLYNKRQSKLMNIELKMNNEL